MLIYCSDGTVREMTEAEEYIANNLPDPHEVTTSEELLSILLGGDTND